MLDNIIIFTKCMQDQLLLNYFIAIYFLFPSLTRVKAIVSDEFQIILLIFFVALYFKVDHNIFMSPNNPCKVKVSLLHLELYLNDLIHKSIVFISLLMG